MKRSFAIIILACILIPSCSPAEPNVTAESITIQYTAATIPWLADLYDCAGGSVVKAEQRAVDFLDPQSAELSIRIGEPSNYNSPAYQIGSEDILVIANRQNLINHLTAEEVRSLFTGTVQTWKEINGSSKPVRVWVFSSGEDVEQIFEQTALGGSPVTSTARLAMGMEEMSQAIADDVNAIGILPRRWKTGDTADVFTAASAPVLAVTPSDPRENIQHIIACLQK